jgi:uncharacterized repeat protein (TIGR01451 family)
MRSRVPWAAGVRQWGPILFLVVSASAASAQTHTWNLSGVQFGDGTSATGWISYDQGTNTVLNWFVAVQAGTLTARTYYPGNSTGRTLAFGGAQRTIFLEEWPSPPGGQRQFRITPSTPLDGTSTTVPLDLSAGAEECFNCSPFRSIVAGSFTFSRTMTVRVAATMSVTGGFQVGGTVTYSVTVTNSGAPQADHPGDEFVNALPSSLTLQSATASAGTTSTSSNTVLWNGALAPGAPVTITIVATVNPGTEGQLISNHAPLNVDSDGSGTSDMLVYTDDPAVPHVGTGNQPTVFQVAWGAADFHTLPPCRVVDTRNAPGPLGAPFLRTSEDRVFTVVGHCAIPTGAKALSLNVAVTQGGAPGNLRVHPAGTAPPNAATINFAAGQTRSNNAVIPLNALGQLAVFANTGSPVHVILDVNGYFQ